MGRWSTASVVALLAAACTSTTGVPGSSPPSPSPISPEPVEGGTWTTYHGDAARSGVAVGGPAIGDVQLRWTSPTLDAAVYAEPLAIGSNVIAATEANTVYALDADSGEVAWKTNLGRPVDSSSLPCGNIQPTSGITSTPVADPATGVLYVAAFLAPATHELFALRLRTGHVLWHRSIDPPGMDPQTQQLRSALALANGRVYAAYGGLFGDCGTYHGWVAAVAADGTGDLIDHQVPTSNAGGIWAPSGPSVDADGNVYVTTGNSFNDAFDFGDSVIKLSPHLSRLDSFTPGNWPELNAGDVDLGSVGPTLLPDDHVFQIGKQGVGYLLSAADLGGIGGELFSSQVCSSSFGGTAHDGDLVFVPCTDGLVALRVSDDRFAVAWRADGVRAGPPILAGGLVWTVDESAGSLLGFETETGQRVVDRQIGTTSHFPSPSASSGCLFVPTLRTVTAFCSA